MKASFRFLLYFLTTILFLSFSTSLVAGQKRALRKAKEAIEKRRLQLARSSSRSTVNIGDSIILANALDIHIPVGRKISKFISNYDNSLAFQKQAKTKKTRINNGRHNIAKKFYKNIQYAQYIKGSFKNNNAPVCKGGNCGGRSERQKYMNRFKK